MQVCLVSSLATKKDSCGIGPLQRLLFWRIYIVNHRLLLSFFVCSNCVCVLDLGP